MTGPAEVADAVVAAGRAHERARMMHRRRALLADCKLTLPALRLLDGPRLRHDEFAQELGLTRDGAYKLLARLFAAELVDRRPAPRTGSWFYHVTEDGAEYREAIADPRSRLPIAAGYVACPRCERWHAWPICRVF